jgi:hypothetical protein
MGAGGGFVDALRPTIEVDMSLIDDDGFMNKRFRSANSDDQHHANREFGAAMMAKVEVLLQSARN